MILFLSMADTPQERSKLERLYEKYKDLMFYAANQILRNPSDAEDAVHEAFLSILQNLDKISDIESQKTRGFVVIIVERKAIDILRRRRRTAEVPLDENALVKAAPEPAGLEEAIGKLPAHYRNVLTLKYVSGFSTGEIAKMLGITPSGVSKLLSRAKTELRTILEEEGIAL